MKTKLTIAFFVFLFQFGFSQTEKLLQGKVINNENPVEGIEVINLMAKKITTTDAVGHFAISVKAKDVLVFISKNYIQKELFIDKSQMDKNNIIVSVLKKTEQLEEVVITSKTTPSIDTNLHKIMDKKYFDDAQSSPKNRFVYNGLIENGMDFNRMYKDLLKLFGKNKDHIKTNVRMVEFKEYALANSNQDFFVKTLKLKPEETTSFLAFCDADPQSKIIAENSNILDLLDFMLSKSIEFKKNTALTINK